MPLITNIFGSPALNNGLTRAIFKLSATVNDISSKYCFGL